MTVARRTPRRGSTGRGSASPFSPAADERLHFSAPPTPTSTINASPTFAELAARQPTPPSMPAPASPTHPGSPRRPPVRSIVVAPAVQSFDDAQISSEWQEVRHKRGFRQPSLPSSEWPINVAQPTRARSHAAEAFIKELQGRCFRCFSHEHAVRHCANLARCIHCLDAGHAARGCPTRHLPRVPLPPLPTLSKPPVRSRLIFPPDHPDANRRPAHTRLTFPHTATPPTNANLRPQHSGEVHTTLPPPPPLADPFPTMSGTLAFVRRPLRTRVVMEHTEEMVEEEIKLRGSALVLTVSGTQPRLAPCHILEGLLLDFPELPSDAVQISLRHPGTFFARFSETRWFELVAAHSLFHFRGTPILVRRWSRLTFASFHKYRYNVRLFIEQLTPQAWSLATVAKALPGCLIHTMSEETESKSDLSYFVVEAWVNRLEDVPTQATMDIHEPKPCVDPLCHADLPPSFSTTDEPLPGAGSPSECCHLQYLRTTPPRVLSTTVLVHLDSSTFIRPAPASRNRWTSHDDDHFEDGDDDTIFTAEQSHPWAHGIADEVWHQRLEAAAAGSAAGQHRTRRRSGGRQRQLTPPGFARVPLGAPPASQQQACPNGVHGNTGKVTAKGPHAVIQDDAVGLDILAAQGTVNPAGPVLLPTLSPTQIGALSPTADQPDEMGEAMLQPILGSQPQSLAPSPLVHVDPATSAAACSPVGVVLFPAAVPAALTTAEPPVSPMARVTSPRVPNLLHTSGPLPGAEAGPPSPVAHQMADAAHALSSIMQPITPGLAALPHHSSTPPGPLRRTRSKNPAAATTATRRSHRVKNRRAPVVGSGGGGDTMKLARRLIISKRGLAIAEKGEESDDDTMAKYQGAFDSPLADGQMGALGTLAKEARRRRRGAPAPRVLVQPVQ